MTTNEIYTLRDSFSIIGLTGRTGSGCTRFSQIISKEIKFTNNTMIRRPEDIEYIESEQFSDNNTIFKRKYTICYNYFKQHYKPYKTISYLSVLIFYAIHYGVKEGLINDKKNLQLYIQKLIIDNFKKSITSKDDDYLNVNIEISEIESIAVDYDKLVELFMSIPTDLSLIKDYSETKSLYNCFYSSTFEEFTSCLFKLFAEKDYYLGSFFVHRLGNKIRATGNPLADGDTLKGNASTEYIYSVVSLINKLIKAWKAENDYCHICIDSLRNSLEIMFLKERYSAFYMISIHNNDRHIERIKERIHNNSSNPNDITLTTSKVISFDNIEHEGDDFKKGVFFAPDVENCIQKSDIHINNPGKSFEEFNMSERSSKFYTMTEQWIKIKSLIMHPGLITPSHDERCMQIAFISKFNSGCISRQVGAVITDENNSIRSVGWNDVPKGSVPCNLRKLDDIINPESIDEKDKSYSPFEKDQTGKSYKDGGNFALKTKTKFTLDVEASRQHGLNHSFCFKTLHNKFEGKDNQVHTRSLHAEENAMLQTSKYGGQPLKNGTLYTTASPCELCAKKAYQLGLNIVYIDPYPGISMKHILANGYKEPTTKMFTGIVNRAYNKLYEPFLPYKDELAFISVSTEDKDEKVKNKIKEVAELLYNKQIVGDIDLEQFKIQIEYLSK